MEQNPSTLKRRRSSSGSQDLQPRPPPALSSHRAGYHDTIAGAAQALDPVHIRPEQLREQVQEAVNIALSSNFKQYASIRCLLISWEDDDLGCLQEVNELQALFDVSYGFSCENFRVPSQDSERQLRLKLTDFDRAIGPDDLFILYYGGHAAMPRPYDDFIWAAAQDGNSATLNWTVLQSIVEQMPSDALLILDCCYAAHVARATIPGKKEVLAASGWENPAVAGVQNRSSFTAFLIHALECLAHLGQAFTISDLFSQIISTTFGPDGRRLARTPLHCQLRCQEPRRPIVLCPQTPQSGSLTPRRTPDPRQSIPAYPRMIVAVSFTGGFENTTAKRIGQWLTSSLPSEIREVCISVELAARSKSTVTIMTMPMALWLALSTHPAVRPCGLITKSDDTPAFADIGLCVVLMMRHAKRWPAYSAEAKRRRQLKASMLKIRAHKFEIDPKGPHISRAKLQAQSVLSHWKAVTLRSRMKRAASGKARGKLSLKDYGRKRDIQETNPNPDTIMTPPILDRARLQAAAVIRHWRAVTANRAYDRHLQRSDGVQQQYLPVSQDPVMQGVSGRKHDDDDNSPYGRPMSATDDATPKRDLRAQSYIDQRWSSMEGREAKR